jgi:excisionase family DNA binding protein
MPAGDDPEYTLGEAAQVLHISVRSLQRLIDDYKIGFERVGNRGIRLRRSDLEEYLATIRAQRPPGAAPNR